MLLSFEWRISPRTWGFYVSGKRVWEGQSDSPVSAVLKLPLKNSSQDMVSYLGTAYPEPHFFKFLSLSSSWGPVSCRSREKELEMTVILLLQWSLPEKGPHGFPSSWLWPGTTHVLCEVKYVSGRVPSTQKTSNEGSQLGWVNLSVFKRQQGSVFWRNLWFARIFLFTHPVHTGLAHQASSVLKLSVGPFLQLSYQPIRADFREWVERKGSRANKACPHPLLPSSKGIY